MQKLRAAERLLKAVLQGDWQDEVVKYTAEQNKSYATGFSMNSREIQNSLRIFFDNWIGTVETSESIQFVFYTNVDIKKENNVCPY